MDIQRLGSSGQGKRTTAFPGKSPRSSSDDRSRESSLKASPPNMEGAFPSFLPSSHRNPSLLEGEERTRPSKVRIRHLSTDGGAQLLREKGRVSAPSRTPLDTCGCLYMEAYVRDIPCMCMRVGKEIGGEDVACICRTLG